MAISSKRWTGGWKYKTPWSLPSSYIYHIKCGKFIYIGQTQATKSESRIESHIQNLFFKGGNYSQLAEEVKKRGLKNTTIEIFESPYGVPEDLMKKFKRKFKKGNGEELNDLDVAEILHILYFRHNSKMTIVNKSMGGQNMSIMMNTRKGFEELKTGFLTRNMSVDSAYMVFKTDPSSLNALYHFRNFFNKAIFNDEEWKSFYKQYKASYERRPIPSDYFNNYAEMSFSELTNLIANNMEKYIITKVNTNGKSVDAGFKSMEFGSYIKETVLKWWKAKCNLIEYNSSLFMDKTNLGKEITKIQDVIEEELKLSNLNAIPEYIIAAISHKAFNESFEKKLKLQIVNEMEKQYTGLKKDRERWSKKLREELGNKKLTPQINAKFREMMGSKSAYYWRFNKSKIDGMKNFAIVGIANIFKPDQIKADRTNKTQWWSAFTAWKLTKGNPISEVVKKYEMLKIFRKIYTSVSDKNYYQKVDPENVFPLDDGFAYYTQRNRLSFSVHEAFKSLEITFAENRWTEFYAKMVSLIISGGQNPWTETIIHKYGLTYDMEEVLMRKNEQLVKDKNGSSYIVVHPLYTYWEIAPEQIDIY